MSFIVFIVLLMVLYAIFKRQPGTKQTKSPIENVNNNWILFIFSYKKIAKTKAQKEIIDQMLAELSSQGYNLPSEISSIDNNTPGYYQSVPSADNQFEATLPNATANANVGVQTEQAVQKAQIQLDNASLLLYFGAFLFVASAGLFVVFASIPGGARSFIVLITSLIMYGGGVWLYKNNPKLKQAGLAFAGIGIAIAPLIGLAVYSYVFNKSNGPAIWFGTSVLCLAMYAHALISLRKPLINYVFILTFLSLFESGVSIINAPIYYFGWMLAAIGMVLMVVSRLKGFWPELQESSSLSGRLFLPLSVLVSIALVPGQGVRQLGVSLLLASAYYGLETLNTVGSLKQSNAIISHVSLLLGIASISYSINKSFTEVAVCLAAVSIIQVIFILSWSSTNLLVRDFATITIISSILTVIAAWRDPVIMLGTCSVLLVVSGVIWLRQKRVDAYVIASAALLISTVIFGQYYSRPRLTYSLQSFLLLVALFVEYPILYLRQSILSKIDLTAMNLTYTASAFAVIASTFWAPPGISLLICTCVAASTAIFINRQNDKDWAVISGLFIMAPLLWSWSNANIFLAALAISMTSNIILSIRYREELNRWFSTFLWLLLPLALSNIHLFTYWNNFVFAEAYLVTMIGLIFSRSVARGVVLVSSKIPMASYARNASISYVVGYWTAAILSIGLAVSGGKSYITPIILSIISIAIWIISDIVEKKPEIFALIPLFVQGVILSTIYTHDGGNSVLIFTFLSSTIAVSSYFAINSSNNVKKLKATQAGALIAVFFTPISVLFAHQAVWTMPIGLCVAAILVFYHVKDTTQEYRELAGGLLVLGIFWVLQFNGVTNVQVYSHILVGLFALYAYWRNTRMEISESNNYLIAMLLTATVPLTLQALGGSSGGLYGWWLIIEQIAFMIIGMAIGKKIVTTWGLYVAVGAVLFQLRGLGWAALAFLAIFIIGLAVYKIQKHTEK